jgi:D-arginine dehydrogenase
MKHFDVAIIGAGIAGASLASELASQASVVILEAEDQPGYHTTGRSNAFWQATYGGPGVAPLTTASRPWLDQHGVLAPRGAIMLARAEDDPKLNAFEQAYRDDDVTLHRLDRGAIERLVPGVLPDWDRGIFEADCFDIDVAELHARYLARVRQNKAEIVCRARIQKAERCEGRWTLSTQNDAYTAKIVVNAAGAWADQIARLIGANPLGVQPFRRTIAQVVLEERAPENLPLVLDISGTFYFRSDHGRLWLSPHDETPSPACDAAPEELDIAVAIDRLQRVVDWRVKRVEHAWAGLRSFAPDRLPIYGFDPKIEGFFWCAGQGGFGIQTAPAAAKICAHLILGGLPDPMISRIDARRYDPARFA